MSQNNDSQIPPIAEIDGIEQKGLEKEKGKEKKIERVNGVSSSSKYLPIESVQTEPCPLKSPEEDVQIQIVEKRKVKEQKNCSTIVTSNYGSKRHWGIILVLLSGFFFATNSIFTRLLIVEYNYSANQQLVLRGYSMSFFSFIWMESKKESLFKLNKKEYNFLKLRSLFLMLIAFLFSNSMKYISASTSNVIFFVHPIIIPFLARILLKTRIFISEILAGIVCIIGIGFVSKPSFIFGSSDSDADDDDEESNSLTFYLVVLMMVGAATFAATHNVICSKYKSSVSSSIAQMYVGIAIIFTASFLAFAIEDNPTEFTVGGFFLVLFGQFLYLLASVCNYLSFKFESPSLLGLLSYTQLVFVIVEECLYYWKFVDMYKGIGSLMIVASSFTVSILKYRRFQK